jgi:hypothetical protein
MGKGRVAYEYKVALVDEGQVISSNNCAAEHPSHSV